MKNKGKKDANGKEIKFGLNLEVLELENRDWETWMLNDLAKNPRKYRKGK